MKTSMNIIKYFVNALLIISLLLSISVNAETQRECDRNVEAPKNLAVGGLAGGAAGTVGGVAVCSAFLAAIFIDWGLSYATCVASVASAGGVAGTVMAHNHNSQEFQKCDDLPNG